MIEGLNHITFIVKDLERTSNFLTSVFEAKEIYLSGEKKYSYSKEKYEKRIRSIGLEILNDRKRFDGEGKSLYFYDYDNHLFELHTGTLGQCLEIYKNNVTPQ